MGGSNGQPQMIVLLFEQALAVGPHLLGVQCSDASCKRSPTAWPRWDEWGELWGCKYLLSSSFMFCFFKDLFLAFLSVFVALLSSI